MSQMTAARVAPRTARPVPRAARPAPRRLHLVDAAPQQQSHAGFAMLCAALVLAGLIAALLLNTARAEGSFTLSDLRAEATRLHDTKVTLEADLASHQGPDALAAKAEKLGLVPSPSTAVLRLSDGAVLGVAAGVQDERPFTVDTSSVTPLSEPAVASAGDATEED